MSVDEIAADQRSKKDRTKDRADHAERSAAHQENIISRGTTRGLHIAEDIVYALTAFILVTGSLIVLAYTVYKFSVDVNDGVKKAIETALSSLLIVFILVELLSAVREAIAEHTLVAEPFLLVGILAAIKEMVVVATFRIETQKPSDTALKIGLLAGVVVALAVATFILRRREREPEERGDADADA